MELADYLRALRTHWRGALACVLTALVAATIFNLTQPKVYAADSSGFVAAGTGDQTASMASVSDSVAKSRAQSYIDIAKSRATAQSVIDELSLDADPSALIQQIEVFQPPETVLIRVTARASTPKSAQGLADAWVRALADQVDEIENPSGRSKEALHIVPYESAALPGAPAEPNMVRNVGLALILGLLAAVGFAVMRSMLDSRLRSATEVERQFGAPVVGQIPLHDQLMSSDGDQAPLAVLPGSASPAVSEAFRKLRTNLAFMNVDDPPRVIVVTSPQPSDGKSTVAANLAAAIALSGQPVTLIDADLRRPSVAMNLGLDTVIGLTDALVGHASISDVGQPHPDVPGLKVVVAGSIPPNPSELLGSRTLQTMIAEIARTGWVILDAPPLIPVTDAAVLSAHSDGCLVVVTHGRTNVTELEQAVSQLNAVSAKILGVVFNRGPRVADVGGYYARPGTTLPTPRVPAETVPEVSRSARGGARRAR
ncbi:polysaccharide biosynthesis tyrosine autokinase [Nocardioides piscis]|uniref:Polysaccharide biosynthesis tyrosine autokinase n=1 Tax=Nocardioides piscis TaxID=2714938 RepID=A0A6G7YFG4_9ACTN|nr:polysaccharide biosynthesis tyrosine autokinase [Nocardioides piscis]QIK75347.1 polysaccharide biosynthesis tyrosine autokinase [Nocardioides piscis]